MSVYKAGRRHRRVQSRSRGKHNVPYLLWGVCGWLAQGYKATQDWYYTRKEAHTLSKPVDTFLYRARHTDTVLWREYRHTPFTHVQLLCYSHTTHTYTPTHPKFPAHHSKLCEVLYTATNPSMSMPVPISPCARHGARVAKSRECTIAKFV